MLNCCRFRASALLAQEFYENEITSEVEQPLFITHDPALAYSLNSTYSSNNGDTLSPSSDMGSLGTVAGQEPLQSTTTSVLPTVTVLQSTVAIAAAVPTSS